MNKENIKTLHHGRSMSLNDTIQQQYGWFLQNSLKKKQKHFNCYGSLAYHKVTSLHRSRLVDWMIQVHKAFNSSKQTLFLSLKLVDLYFKQQTQVINLNDLQIIGTVCIFIASKYMQVKPIRINLVYYKITHKKVSKDYIRKMEQKILKVLDYSISVPTVAEFLDISLQNHSYQEYQKALLIAQLVQLDSKLSAASPSLLAQALALVTRRNVLECYQTPVYRIMQQVQGFLRSFQRKYHQFQASLSKFNAIIRDGDVKIKKKQQIENAF